MGIPPILPEQAARPTETPDLEVSSSLIHMGRSPQASPTAEPSLPEIITCYKFRTRHVPILCPLLPGSQALTPYFLPDSLALN